MIYIIFFSDIFLSGFFDSKCDFGTNLVAPFSELKLSIQSTAKYPEP